MHTAHLRLKPQRLKHIIELCAGHHRALRHPRRIQLERRVAPHAMGSKMGDSRNGLVLAFFALGCAQAGERSIGDDYVRQMYEARCVGAVTHECAIAPIGMDECLSEGWLWRNTTLARAIDQGDVVVDDAVFAACIDELRTCAIPSPACATAFTGTLATGSPCETSLQCESGAFCHRLPASRCGACTPRLALGAECPRIGSCLPAPFVSGREVECVPDEASTLLGHCREIEDERTLASVGEHCGPVDLTDTYCRFIECEVGLSCFTQVDEGVFRCEDVSLPEGAVCEDVFQCARELVCGGRCLRPVIVSELGASCTTASCDTSANLVCIASVCSRLPTQVGDACDSSGCGVGLFCSAGTCTEARSNGGSCVSDAMCQSRFCASGQCTAPFCD